MLTAEQTIPAEWLDTSVVRNLDAPYSDEALAEANKTWVDAGEVNLDSLPHLSPKDLGYKVYPFKGRTVDADISRQVITYQELHHKFANAARLILGSEMFADSEIYFDHWTNDLSDGQSHTFTEPHMDGTFPDIVNLAAMATSEHDGKSQLKLLGTAVNVLPTTTWQGSVERSDFYPDGDRAAHLRPSVVESKKVTPKPIPTNRLMILSPATIHSGPIANRNVGRRHFLRWHLYI